MSIKLNGHTLTNKTLRQMKTIMKESMQIGKEMGFTLCADKDNNLHTGNLCIGDHCSIEIGYECDKDQTYAGHHHTHPAGLSNASTYDLLSCGIDHNVCISGKDDNKTRCYVWQHMYITPEKRDDIKRLYDKGIRNMDNSAYQKNFECIKEITPLNRIQEMMHSINIDPKIREFEKKYYKEKILDQI